MGSISIGFLFFLFFSTLISFSQQQNCEILISATRGNDTLFCGGWSNPCKTFNGTLQYLNSSNCFNNATISIEPGVYSGALNRNIQFVFFAKNLFLQRSQAFDGDVIFDGENEEFILSLDIYNGSVHISNITFTRGRSQNLGGGCLSINYRFSGKYTIENTKFINCKTKFDAGGLYTSANEPSNINYCEFVNNIGIIGGGAFLKGGVITITSTNFTDNSASLFGGGLNAAADMITFQSCLFRNNTSAFGGGASISSSVVIANSSFFDNTATAHDGGALHITQAETTSISSSEFARNSAFMGGGIFFYLEEDYQVLFSNLLIHNNSAKSSGGGIYILEAGNVTLIGLTIQDNRATIGGGLYIRAIKTFTVVKTDFRSNSASSKGGGIACDSTTQVTASNVTFITNSAVDCAYSEHVIDSGTCLGIFTQCAQKQSLLNCDSCLGYNCMEDKNRTYHCFSNDFQNCVCSFPAPSPSVSPAPSTGPTPQNPSASTIAGIAIGVVGGSLVLLGVGYYCWKKYLAKKEYGYVPVR